MSKAESKKLRRETDPPRVTFTTSTRTFERLLKENSLDALRFTVIKKLGLEARTPIEFSQLRDGKSIDLEDEDDFEAFRSYATFCGVAEVRVNVLSAPVQRINTPEGLRATSTGSHGRSTFETSRLMPNLGVMSPVSQANENSALSSVLADHALPEMPVMSKQKEKKAHRSKAISSSVASTEIPRLLSNKRETPESVRKRSRSSNLKHAPNTSLDGTDPQTTTDNTTQHAKNGTQLPAEQSSATTGRSVKEKKDKKDKEVKSTKKVTKTNSAIVEPPAGQTNEDTYSHTTPADPSIPSHELARQAASGPTHVPKEINFKTQEAPSSTKTTDDRSPSHEQSGGNISSVVSTDAMHVRQLEDGHSENNKPAASSRDNQTGKKRKLEPEDKTGSEVPVPSKLSKAKRRKTNNEDATLAPAVSGEAATGDMSAPPKPSKSKKKGKPTPEEMSQYDADLDNAIASVLAKRVSASKQTVSTAPVTTTTSPSVHDKGVGKEHLVEAGTDDTSISKRKRRKKSKKGKNTDVSTPAHSTSVLESTAPDTTSESNVVVKPLLERRITGQQRERLHHGSRRDSSNSATVRTEGTSVTKRPTQEADAALGGQGHTPSTPIATQHESTTQSTVNSGEHQEITTNDIVSSSFNKKQHPISTLVPPLLPAGSSISENAMQVNDEGSSSDSDSISEFPDSDNEDAGNAVATQRTQRSQARATTHLVSPGTVAIWKTDSSLPNRSIDVDASFDLEALFKPRATLSWRDIPLSWDDGGGGEKELMSDAEDEEDEEKEAHRKAPRSSLPFRREYSSTSPDEDDEGESDGAADGSSVLHHDSKMTTNHTASPKDTVDLEEIKRTPSAGAKTRRAFERPKETNQSTLDSTKSVEPVVNSQKDGDRQLLSWKDVNACGESIVSEGTADYAVTQAMQEDYTLFLTGHNKSNFSKTPTSNEEQSEERRSSPLTFRANSIDRPRSVSESSKESEERNPSVFASSKGSDEDTSQATSNVPVPDVTKPPSKTSSQHAKIMHNIAHNLVHQIADTTRPQLPPPRVQTYSRNSITGSVGKTSGFAELTSRGQRSQWDVPSALTLADSGESSGSQSVDLPSSERTDQRKSAMLGDRRSAVEKSGKRNQTSLEVTLPPSSQREGSVSPQATYKTSKPAVAAPNQAISNFTVLRDAKPTSVGRHMSDINAASTIEVEQSADGDKDMTHEYFLRRPSTQPGRTSRSPEQNAPSFDSSASDDSESDGDDNHPLMERVHGDTSRASIVCVPTLTDIASRRDLFSPASTPRPSFALSPVKSFGSQMSSGDVRGRDVSDNNDDSLSSSSSSSSDSDSEADFNVPKGKRAGRTVEQSKPSSGGLKSYFSFF